MRRSEILQLDEIKQVVAHAQQASCGLTRHAASCQLITFRLSCCCGLRRCEIAGVNLGDFLLQGSRPHITIRAEIAKRNKEREVPLWWDKGTLEDLQRWHQYRIDKFDAGPVMPFVCTSKGRRLAIRTVTQQWKTALRKALGPQRARGLGVHVGRHSFCSHALRGGRSLLEVQDAAGHSRLATTSIYLHALDREGLPDIFAAGRPTRRSGVERASTIPCS